MQIPGLIEWPLDLGAMKKLIASQIVVKLQLRLRKLLVNKKIEEDQVWENEKNEETWANTSMYTLFGAIGPLSKRCVKIETQINEGFEYIKHLQMLKDLE